MCGLQMNFQEGIPELPRNLPLANPVSLSGLYDA